MKRPLLIGTVCLLAVADLVGQTNPQPETSLINDLVIANRVLASSI